MDPQSQHAASALAGLGIGLILFGVLFFLAIILFFIFLFWRIFTKAGLSGPLALLILIPGVGYLVVLCILAFSDWNVAPIVPAGYLPSVYPPPPSSFPPAPPPPPQL
jgi:uncharacterized membrane protein YhaH (DUF805 family)